VICEVNSNVESDIAYGTIVPKCLQFMDGSAPERAGMSDMHSLGDDRVAGGIVHRDRFMEG
jgi:hypothetical protein